MRGCWEWHPGLCHPEPPNAISRTGASSGPERVSAGQPRPGNSANSGARQVWAVGIALHPGFNQEGRCGVQAVGGEVGTGSSEHGHVLPVPLFVPPPLHFISSPWCFLDNGDHPDTTVAESAITGIQPNS